jgi:protein required for attachment to host cells
MAYDEVEPWGEWRADVRAGIIASTLANIHRKSGAKAYTAADFMPKFGQDHEALTPQESAARIHQAMQAVAGRFDHQHDRLNSDKAGGAKRPVHKPLPKGRRQP